MLVKSLTVDLWHRKGIDLRHYWVKLYKLRNIDWSPYDGNWKEGMEHHKGKI